MYKIKYLNPEENIINFDKNILNSDVSKSLEENSRIFMIWIIYMIMT